MVALLAATLAGFALIHCLNCLRLSRLPVALDPGGHGQRRDHWFGG